MNALATFFTAQIVYIYFFYGLAFFSLGLTLQSATRQQSAFRFARAIVPLALFGYLHGAHEWVEMFQQITLRRGGAVPPAVEGGRLVLLMLSFTALIVFSVQLETSPAHSRLRRYGVVWGLLLLWASAVLIVVLLLRPTGQVLFDTMDVLARYLLAIPGALLAARALMAQQHSFREQHLARFGRDLVWCAVALILYGAVGQLFVRPLDLPPANLLNSQSFLAWFGVPIQLVRALLAAILTLYMVRVLRVFDVENRRRLDEANRVRFQAQAAALDAERRNSQAIAELNDELRVTARELALVVELANLLGLPGALDEKLPVVLHRIVDNLHSTDAGLILFSDVTTGELDVATHTGFVNMAEGAPEHIEGGSRFSEALLLAQRSVAESQAFCRHVDGHVLAMAAEFTLLEQLCRGYASPTLYIALPLIADEVVIGSLALARARVTEQALTTEDLQLLTGIAHQLGLSIHNAQLSQQARQREAHLADLLHAVVSAQENERQRIARELHDATGQTLTAIALGLRGMQTMIVADRSAAPAHVPVTQVAELEGFATTALGELHQIISDLRPPQLDDLGLPAALRWYVQEFGKRRAVTTSFQVEGRTQALPDEYEIVIFRTTQEALTNVAKHACAGNVAVTLRYTPSRVRLTVQDDGIGFDAGRLSAGYRVNGQAGWGLLGIHERAALLGGQIVVTSCADQGTTIEVDIPLPDSGFNHPASASGVAGAQHEDVQ